MQQSEAGVTARKKLVGRLGAILAIVVVLFTFLSKTIDNLLMPKVTTVNIVKGSLQESFETKGTVEFANKAKIYAGGVWKVKEVAVKAGQRVQKGDLLAAIDEKDIQLAIKTGEYELLKLENELQSYKDSFKPIRLADYERDLQLAKREMDRAKEEFDRAKQLYEAGSEAKADVDAAEDNYADKQFACQLKQDSLEDAKKEAAAQQDEFDRNVAEKTAEINIKKMQLEKEEGDLPVDGKILSGVDGLVAVVNIEPGMETEPGRAMFEIAGDTSPYRFVWYLPAEKAVSFAAGGQVNLEATGEVVENGPATIKTVTLQGQITGKEFSADQGAVKFWADVGRGEDKAEISIAEGQEARVWSVLNSPVYDNLLPKGSVTQIGGKDCIFIVKTRKGALGTEDFVEQNEVEVLGEDDFNVAVNGFFMNDEQVVAIASKPLSDGMRVHVR